MPAVGVLLLVLLFEVEEEYLEGCTHFIPAFKQAVQLGNLWSHRCFLLLQRRQDLNGPFVLQQDVCPVTGQLQFPLQLLYFLLANILPWTAHYYLRVLLVVSPKIMST